jgi:hypothetical protein
MKRPKMLFEPNKYLEKSIRIMFSAAEVIFYCILS